MSSPERDLFTTILRAKSYQVTKARLAVFELLQSDEPQTLKQLLDRANGSVDRVSVYRNIELFEKLGIVQRIYIGWKYKLELTDQFTGHHHHLSCLRCGNVIDIDDEQHIDEFITAVAKKYNFTPRRHQFEIDGYCKKCSALAPSYR